MFRIGGNLSSLLREKKVSIMISKTENTKLRGSSVNFFVCFRACATDVGLVVCPEEVDKNYTGGNNSIEL